MKVIVIFFVLGAVAAAPQHQSQQEVQLLRYENNNGGQYGYSFAYEQSNGQKHEEKGQLKNQGTENEALTVSGQYSWVGPDGVTYLVSYVADENGFQPRIQQGAGGAIPTHVIETIG